MSATRVEPSGAGSGPQSAQISFPAIEAGMNQDASSLHADVRSRLADFNGLRDEMLFYMAMERMVDAMGKDRPLAVLDDVTNAQTASSAADALALSVARHKEALEGVCETAREAARARAELDRLSADAQRAEDEAADALEGAGLSRGLSASEAEAAVRALEAEAEAAERRLAALEGREQSLAAQHERAEARSAEARAEAERAEEDAAAWSQRAEMAQAREEAAVAAAQHSLDAVRAQEARAEAIAAAVAGFTGVEVTSASASQVVLSLAPRAGEGSFRVRAELDVAAGAGTDGPTVAAFRTDPPLATAALEGQVRAGAHVKAERAAGARAGGALASIAPLGARWVVRRLCHVAARRAALEEEVRAAPGRFAGAMVHADDSGAMVTATLACGAVAALAVDAGYPAEELAACPFGSVLQALEAVSKQLA